MSWPDHVRSGVVGGVLDLIASVFDGVEDGVARVVNAVGGGVDTVFDLLAGGALASCIRARTGTIKKAARSRFLGTLRTPLSRREEGQVNPLKSGDGASGASEDPDATKSTRKTTNRILATPAAVPAIPPKPRTAAIKAMTRKVMAQQALEFSYVMKREA